MIIGVDLDNTIINYDSIFRKKIKIEFKHKEKKLVDKISLKKYLIKNNRANEWKLIQSEIYSKYIFEASLNIEILKLLKYLDKKKIRFYIVSHKTVYPHKGDKINLHKLSSKWIKTNLFNKKNNFKKKYKFFFETTKRKKLKRIKSLKITHFIDDLDDVLKSLPSYINPIKFDKAFKFTSIKKKYITQDI